MPHDVQMRWNRATGNGPPVERWFAGVERPTFTDSFAQVERIDGQWWLILFTRACRRYNPDLKEQRIPYASPRTAKKHLEAWTSANWPMIKRRFGIYTPPVRDETAATPTVGIGPPTLAPAETLTEGGCVYGVGRIPGDRK